MSQPQNARPQLVLALDMRPACTHAALFSAEPGAAPLFSATFPLAASRDLFLDCSRKEPEDGEVNLAAFSHSFWKETLAGAGFPGFEGQVVAAVHDLYANEAALAAREAFFRSMINNDGARLALLGPGAETGGCPLPPLLERLRGVYGFWAADAVCASLLGLLARQDIRERGFREGLTLVHLEHGRAYCALVFQDRLLAFAEGYRDAWLDQSYFLADLDSFRLGWLPEEKALDMGGFSVAPSELPAEAEGFRPLYVSGPGASWLEGFGVIAPGAGPSENIFQGLLLGLALR